MFFCVFVLFCFSLGLKFKVKQTFPQGPGLGLDRQGISPIGGEVLLGLV